MILDGEQVPLYRVESVRVVDDSPELQFVHFEMKDREDKELRLDEDEFYLVEEEFHIENFHADVRTETNQVEKELVHKAERGAIDGKRFMTKFVPVVEDSVEFYMNETQISSEEFESSRVHGPTGEAEVEFSTPLAGFDLFVSYDYKMTFVEFLGREIHLPKRQLRADVLIKEIERVLQF